jgi:hypothetical protein
MKRKLGLVALLMVMVVLLTACGNGLEGPEWKMDGDSDDVTYTFKSGTLTMKNAGLGATVECKYKVDGKKVTITPPESLGSDPVTYEFKVDGNKLTLTGDGDTITFTKK